MRKILIGVSAAALALGGTAFAAPGQGRFNPDSNGDGAITRAESQSQSAAMFAKMDANSDGKVDQTDRDARRQARRTQAFDGMDANKNGSISRDEFMAFERPGKGERVEGEGRRGGHGKHHRWGRRGGHHGMMMQSADANKDGALSQAEFTAAAAQRFDTIDANKDGQITKEERDNHRQQMRGKWRQQRDAS